MRGAIIVVDMLRDAIGAQRGYAIAPLAMAIVPAINRVTSWARARGWPVVFACDSFLPDDFIFGGKMKPHSLRGTPGAELIDELEREPGDHILPKRRFSAFFKTDLDQSLRTWGVDTAVVCGISTHFCVLTTVMDALCHDFAAVLLEDATAAPSVETHRRTLANYRRNPLYPLLRVMTVEELIGGA